MGAILAQQMTGAVRSLAIAIAVLGGLSPAANAGAADTHSAPLTSAAAREIEGTSALLDALSREFKAADPTHEPLGATRVREMSLALGGQIVKWHAKLGDEALGSAQRTARDLEDTLAVTRERLRPWPPPLSIDALLARLGRELQLTGLKAQPSPMPYQVIDALLDDTEAAARSGRRLEARADATDAYALFAAGPGVRLRSVNAAVGNTVSDAFWSEDRSHPGLLTALDRQDTAVAVIRASERARSETETAATVLGDRSIGKGAVIADAAVIVFREGLEAILILAAITASFVGERRALRRPVFIGALLGLGASAATYVVAQALIDAFGDGGLQLQAITGLLAIAVLLVVTNWFFHRVYWSEWIGRFHRRRKSLERIDRFGFLSGQLVGFNLLGLTSVYREGFETVLFLQNLQVSAGTHATILGILIGLGGTLAVGFITFRLERKLPYRRMLIATGILIGLVLAVMVGTTVHTLQGLAWIPTTQTGFHLELWYGQWLGIYNNWEGITAQLGALLVVYGSYALARGLQRRRRRRPMGRSMDIAATGESAME